MKYLSSKEISVLFFTAYFYYSRSRFGKEGEAETRRGEIGACRNVMRLCRPWLQTADRVPRSALAEAFSALSRQADPLPEGALKNAYLQTLEELYRSVV